MNASSARQTHHRRSACVAGLCASAALACGIVAANAAAATMTIECKPAHAPVRIGAGVFRMGAGRLYADEGPARQVHVEAFEIDAHEITNAQFAAFVKATHYVTRAERGFTEREAPDMTVAQREPGAAVFIAPAAGAAGRWAFAPGANWRRPAGPGSSIEGRMNYPVVQIALEDAQAFARWAGRTLPTEAEWEYAARGGLDGATFAWGDELLVRGAWQANAWQGVFPHKDVATDGHAGVAPVGCYAPNGYGLYDMIGNVWEWTSTAYQAGERSVGVIKGGSYLCSADYCQRYRPAARHPHEVNLGTNHLGFRTVRRLQPQ